MKLTDSMILQMLGEADAAERRAGEDALTIGCSPQQVHDIELGARCETIRSYLYQAGILRDLAALAGPAREPQWQPTGFTHRLKIWPCFFDDVASGRKPFELRYNDRDFKVGDELLLQEWESGVYSGRETRKRVTYVLQDVQRFGLHHDAAILGLAPCPSPEPEPQG